MASLASMIRRPQPLGRGKMALMGALYRKARPATFDAVVGQEHVKEVLQSAIKQGRLAHAYLFSGPRGVGKTTTARLLAMSVGCSATPELRPCGECENCRLVREDRHPDVIEIDAASNNSVDDVRELRERILLAPLLAPKKVIILDEAHMMSKSAFNALLKTLEEPPEHVIFVFATTEPERMPATILSRTQHFRFRRLSEEEIAGKLQQILETEGRSAEPEALLLIARMSGGAMRDAESILDRLLALEADPITRQAAEEALGLPPAERVAEIALALDAGAVDRAIAAAKKLFGEGYAARTLTEQVSAALQAGLYARLKLGEGPELKSDPERIIAALTTLDEHTDKLIRREDPFTLELGLLRAYAALQETASPAQPAVAAPAAPGSARQPKPKPQGAPASAQPKVAPAAGGEASAQTENEPDQQAASSERPRQGTSSAPPPELLGDLATAWRQVLKRAGVKVRAFLLEAQPHLEEDALVLVYDEGHRFHHDRAKEQQEAIEAVVREILGKPVRFALGKKNPPVAESLPEATQVPFGEPVVEEPPLEEPPEEAAPPPEETAAAAEEREPPTVEPSPEPQPPDRPKPRKARGNGKQRRRSRRSEPAEPRFEKIELLEDPRFEKLRSLFNARLREVWSEKTITEEDEPLD